MATTVVYGYVTMHNVVTREFSQEPVRDPSGTDRMYDRIRYMCEAVLTPSAITDPSTEVGTTMPLGRGNDTSGQLLGHLHGQLNRDRGDFALWMDGILVVRAIGSLASRPNSQDVDVNSGPKIIHFKTTNVAPATIRVEWGVEVCLVCCNDDRNSWPVLSNRWSCVDDLDENFRTTRYWRGMLRVSQAIYNPHRFRGMVVPRLQQGWKRVRMHFQGEANSLELGYEIIDQEMVGQAPPDPATKMRCTHSEHFEESGIVQHGDLSIRLDGPRGADKKVMLQRCFQVLAAKLQVAQTSDNLLKRCTVVDHIGDDVNAVELTASVMRVPKSTDSGALTLQAFASPLVIPQYNGNECVITGPYGTADLAGVFACYLQEPCYYQHAFPASEVPEGYISGDPKDRGVTPKTQTTYAYGPATSIMKPVKASSYHESAIYTHLRIESHFERDENRVALPVAKTNASTAAALAVIRLAPSTMLRRVRLAAERSGAHVQLWRPDDFNADGIDHKLLECTINLRPPEIGGDGKKAFAVDGEYLFALVQTPARDAPLPVGALFWDDQDPSNNKYDAGQYLSLYGSKGLQ